MNNADEMRKTVAGKNGVYPLQMNWFGKQVPVPMTTNFDVLACSAFTFTVLRNFLLSKEMRFWPRWSVASEGGQGKVWHTTTDHSPDDTSLPHGDGPLALDKYLALPWFGRVDATRKIDNYVRFLPDHYGWDSAATAYRVRGQIDEGEIFSTAWLMEFTSKFAFRDVVGTDRGYQEYLERAVFWWDKLIEQIAMLNTYYVLPRGKNFPGEKTGDAFHVKLFWQVISGVFNYISMDAGEYQNKLQFSDQILNAAKEYGSGVKEILGAVAEGTGQAAATVMNEAGKDLGLGFKGFFEGASLWGLGFVALLIAYKVYV